MLCFPVRSISFTAFRCLKEIRNNPQAGSQLAEKFSITSGTLYPMLRRLESQGVLKSCWEKVDPKKAGRPRMRFYALTKIGKKFIAMLDN